MTRGWVARELGGAFEGDRPGLPTGASMSTDSSVVVVPARLADDRAWLTGLALRRSSDRSTRRCCVPQTRPGPSARTRWTARTAGWIHSAILAITGCLSRPLPPIPTAPVAVAVVAAVAIVAIPAVPIATLRLHTLRLRTLRLRRRHPVLHLHSLPRGLLRKRLLLHDVAPLHRLARLDRRRRADLAALLVHQASALALHVAVELPLRIGALAHDLGRRRRRTAGRS